MNCKYCTRTLADGIYLGGGIIRCKGCQRNNFVVKKEELEDELPKPEIETQEIETQEVRPRKRSR